MNIIRTIYICVALAFFVVAIGNAISLNITWHGLNIGQKISGLFGILINMGIGTAIFFLYKSTKQKAIMTDKEFDMINQSMKKEEVYPYEKK